MAAHDARIQPSVRSRLVPVDRAGGSRQLAPLLIGMYFKYLGTPRTEIGVRVVGMAHGLVFIAFVVAGLLVGIALKWRAGTGLLALPASIVPLCSVIFLIWADRTGRMGPSGAASAVLQPGRRAPETT